MNKFYDPNDAANWLKKGKILIHPTEGVWGIGCDAFNAAAVKKINSLKQREASKSLILLASSISDALRYFQPVSEQKIKFLETVWPGHTTVIYNKNKLIPDLKNNTIGYLIFNGTLTCITLYLGGLILMKENVFKYKTLQKSVYLILLIIIAVCIYQQKLTIKTVLGLVLIMIGSYLIDINV